MFIGSNVGQLGRVWSGSGSATAPALDLPFLGGVLDPRITFTRASVATYFDINGVMQTTGTNVPRFDYDPVTHVPLGLLIEEPRTNVMLQSADLSNAAWSKAAIGAAAPIVTANQTIAPDGTTTAARVDLPVISGAGALSRVAQNQATAAAAYSFSIYLRGAVGGEQPYLYATDATTWYRTLVTLTTSWQRFTLTTSTLTAAGWFFAVGADLRDGSQSARAAMSIYAWGGQVEVGPFPTSYIPTGGTAVTRAVDVATMPLPGTWYNNAAGSFAADFITAQAAAAGTQAGILRWDDGTSNNNAGLWVSSTSNLFAYAGAVANTAQINATAGPLIPSVVNRIASTYGSANWTAAGNGAAVQNGSGNTVLVAPSRLLLGGSNTSSTIWKLNGTLRRVRYWPRQLSNAELQSVTGEPSFDLSFFGPTLDPTITFTRASVGTYFDATGVMQTAASGAPRFDYDPATLEARGLLIEEARTNQYLQSGDFTQSVWQKISGVTLTPGIPGPNGPTTGSGIISPSGQQGYVQQNYTSVAGTTVTISYFAKAAAQSIIIIFVPGVHWADAALRSCSFNLATGMVNSVNGGTAVGAITPAGNGWYRVAMTITPDQAATSAPQIGRSSVNGDGVSIQHYAFGAQLEAGAFPTSYIPTAGASVTRAVDWIQILQTFNAPLSWVYETRHPSNVNIQVLGGVGNAAGFNDTFYNQVSAASTNCGLSSRVGGAGLGGITAAPYPLNADNKIGVTLDNNRRQLVSNGTSTVASDITATTLPAYTRMILCASPFSSIAPTTNVYNGWIRRARVWPRELSATELVTVTR